MRQVRVWRAVSGHAASASGPKNGSNMAMVGGSKCDSLAEEMGLAH